MSRYVVECVHGPQAGRLYTRRGVVLRFTRVKAAKLAGTLNATPGHLWIATPHAPTRHAPSA